MSLASLCASAWALSALRVAADSDLFVHMKSGKTAPGELAHAVGFDPSVTMRILECLEANGFVQRNGDGFVLSAEGAELAGQPDWLRADLAATLGQTAAFVRDARNSDLASGWKHTDPELIRAYGTLSDISTTRGIEPGRAAIPDLERLSRPGATVLDVGAGACGGLIALCRRFPTLKGVGVEPLRAARLEARAAIALAGMSDRIEVRASPTSELPSDTYDLAFIATPFMSDDALRSTLGHVRRALVPGGRLLIISPQVSADASLATAAKLRWQLWGGGTRTVADLIRLATEANLEARQGPASGSVIPVVCLKG